MTLFGFLAYVFNEGLTKFYINKLSGNLILLKKVLLSEILQFKAYSFPGPNIWSKYNTQYVFQL